MPSFMIGDILDQKRSIQSPLEQSDESLDWEIPSLKDINPMDLCTRLPFSITPWLSNQQFASDLRFTEQEKLHPHDNLLNSGDPFRGFLEQEDLASSSSLNRRSFNIVTTASTINTATTTVSSINESIHDEGTIGKSKKARKARTAFSDHQLNELERTFERQKYLSVQDRMQLAEKLHLSDMQVKTWYQNRRTKWKRQASVGMELLTEATNNANRFFHQHQNQRSSEERNVCHRHGLLEPLSALMMRATLEVAKRPPAIPPSGLLALFSNSPPSSVVPPNRPHDLDLLKCLPLPPQPPLPQIPSKSSPNVSKPFDYYTSQ